MSSSRIWHVWRQKFFSIFCGYGNWFNDSGALSLIIPPKYFYCLELTGIADSICVPLPGALESQRRQQAKEREINACPSVSAPSGPPPWSSVRLGTLLWKCEQFLAIQRALQCAPGMQPLHFQECCWLLRAGLLIRAVEKGWKKH